MMRIVREELKAVDPNYLVMTGGFANFNDKAGLQELVIKEAQDWYEVHTVHGHGRMDHLRREMALINAARARYRATDKPIYSKETAWWRGAGTPARVQVTHFTPRLPFHAASGSGQVALPAAGTATVAS